MITLAVQCVDITQVSHSGTRFFLSVCHDFVLFLSRNHFLLLWPWRTLLQPAAMQFCLIEVC